MQGSKADDKQVIQLIKDRMDECGMNVIDIAEQNVYLAQLINKGIKGYPVEIKDDDLYHCAQLLGLISHHKYASGQPSRDGLVTLLRYGESSYPVGFPPLPPSETLSDWEKY